MRRVAALTAAWLLLMSGCGTGTEAGPRAGRSGEDAVVVLAASSLTEAFTRIASDFETAHPGTSVTLAFGASSTLAQQVLAGAPADVFASADTATMSQVTDAGAAAGRPTVFARNRLEIAVPAGNPAGVRGLEDFAEPDLTVALCAPEVPCGAAAARAFAAAGVTPRPDTLEEDVKAALTKVRLGEVDAALVYRTDVVAAAGDVDGLDFPESRDAVNDYPLVALTDASAPRAAHAFVEYVLSERAQQVLADAGFARQ